MLGYTEYASNAGSLGEEEREDGGSAEAMWSTLLTEALHACHEGCPENTPVKNGLSKTHRAFHLVGDKIFSCLLR